MPVETIVAGVHQVGSGPSNAFVIDGDEGVVLLDALLPKKEGAIAEALAGVGRSLDDVTAIVLTHSHGDHTGSAAAVKEASNAAVYASEADAPAIRGDEKPPAPPVKWYGVPFKLVVQALPGADPTEVDHFVSEIGGVDIPADLRAVDTPGHTPGHTSYLLDRSGGVLFVGDAAKATKDGRVIRGYFNRSTPSIDKSISHLADQEFEIAAFGHTPAIRSGASGAFRHFAESIH